MRAIEWWRLEVKSEEPEQETTMPKIEVPEETILDSLDELSPRARSEALRRLLPMSRYLERAIERNRPRIEALARERGLDWNALSDQQRESLIDDLVHE
jgi:hypothetical protein